MKLEIVLLLFVIIIVVLMFYIFFKFKLYGAINYIVGSILIIMLCKIDLSGGFYSKEEGLVYFIELFCFTILYFSSFLRFFFRDECEKRKYFFLFPIIFYSSILLFFTFTEGRSIFLWNVAKNLFLAYFPLSIIFIYRKKIIS